MGMLELVLVSFAAGVVVAMLAIFFVLFFRKGNLWDQGFHDGWIARGDSIAEAEEASETREQNKL